MVEWWQSFLLPLFLTSKDCLIEICWAMTPQTVPSFSCIFSVLCRFDRTFRRFSALPLHEPPPSRQVDFLAHHLLLGSSPELKQNSLFSIILSRHTHIRLANVFQQEPQVALLLGPLSSFELFLGLLGMIRVKMAPSKLDSAFGPRWFLSNKWID